MPPLESTTSARTTTNTLQGLFSWADLDPQAAAAAAVAVVVVVVDSSVL
jgi:hypothetical protein